MLKPALKTSVNYNIYEESCIFFHELQGINFAQVNNGQYYSCANNTDEEMQHEPEIYNVYCFSLQKFESDLKLSDLYEHVINS